MHPMGDTRQHLFLTLGMARACDADLGEALKAGRITSADYAEIITRCRSCEEPGKCRTLLDEVEKLAAAPDYCVNAEALAQLRHDAS